MSCFYFQTSDLLVSCYAKSKNKLSLALSWHHSNNQLMKVTTMLSSSSLLLFILLSSANPYARALQEGGNGIEEELEDVKRSDFPTGFLLGVATSSYQVYKSCVSLTFLFLSAFFGRILSMKFSWNLSNMTLLQWF